MFFPLQVFGIIIWFFLGCVFTVESTILRVTLMSVPGLFFGAEGVLPLFYVAAIGAVVFMVKLPWKIWSFFFSFSNFITLSLFVQFLATIAIAILFSSRLVHLFQLISLRFFLSQFFCLLSSFFSFIGCSHPQERSNNHSFHSEI